MRLTRPRFPTISVKIFAERRIAMSNEDRLQFEAELDRLAVEARRLDTETALNLTKTLLTL